MKLNEIVDDTCARVEVLRIIFDLFPVVTEVAKLDPAVQENADWGGDFASSPYVRGIGRQNGNLLVLLELEQVLDFSVLDKLPMPAAV